MVKDNTKKQTFRKGLSRTLNLQYIKLLALFLVFTILWVLLFGKFIYPTLTYESGGYIAISSTTAFLIMIAIPIITWFCFSFWFFKKPLFQFLKPSYSCALSSGLSPDSIEIHVDIIM